MCICMCALTGSCVWYPSSVNSGKRKVGVEEIMHKTWNFLNRRVCLTWSYDKGNMPGCYNKSVLKRQGERYREPSIQLDEKLVGGWYIQWCNSGLKLLCLPEGYDGCDQDAANQILTLFSFQEEKKQYTAWLSSLLTFWCLSQYCVFFFSPPLSGFFPLLPTFPISPVVTETEDTGVCN